MRKVNYQQSPITTVTKKTRFSSKQANQRQHQHSQSPDNQSTTTQNINITTRTCNSSGTAMFMGGGLARFSKQPSPKTLVETSQSTSILIFDRQGSES